MFIDESDNRLDSEIQLQLKDLTCYSSKRGEWPEWVSQSEVWGKNSPDICTFNMSGFESDSDNEWDHVDESDRDLLTEEALSRLARELDSTQGLWGFELAAQERVSQLDNEWTTDTTENLVFSDNASTGYSLNDYNIDTDSEYNETASSANSEMDATGLWAQKLDRFKDQEPENNQGWPALIQEKLQEDSDYFEDTEDGDVPVEVYAKYSGVGSEYITPLYKEHCQQAEAKTSCSQPAIRLEQDSVLTAFLSELRGAQGNPWFAEDLEEKYSIWPVVKTRPVVETNRIIQLYMYLIVPPFCMQHRIVHVALALRFDAVKIGVALIRIGFMARFGVSQVCKLASGTKLHFCRQGPRRVLGCS
jgi:hypothetical protein